MPSGIQSVFSSQQYCVFGKVAGLGTVFVRSVSAHDKGRLSHLKTIEIRIVIFVGRFEN